MLVKVSNDTYSGKGDGESRLKFFAAKVLPYSVEEENKMLLKRLEAYSKKDQQSDQQMQY